MAFTPEQIDFIKANKGKISQREMAKMLGVSQGTISQVFTGNTHYYKPEVRRVYYKNNKSKCNAHSKTYYLKNKDSINSKLKDAYQKKKEQSDIRSWETQVDEGIEIYHFVMRRNRLPRKIVYQRLRKEFEDIQRLRKAA